MEDCVPLTPELTGLRWEDCEAFSTKLLPPCAAPPSAWPEALLPVAAEDTLGLLRMVGDEAAPLAPRDPLEPTALALTEQLT